MPEASFELESEIPAKPSEVHAFLSDLEQLRVLHPLIVGIERLPPRPERPAAERFRVTDRFAFGPLRFHTRYTAELESMGPDEIHGRAWQSPGITLEAIYRLEPSGAGTRLREHTRIAGPRLLFGFARRQGEAAHRTTLDNLKRHFGG